MALTVFGQTMTAAALLWDAVDGAAAYRVYRNGSMVFDGSKFDFIDSGLDDSTEYTYRVTSYDGTTEADIATVTATTNTAPELITDRTLADVSQGTRKGRYNALDLIRVGEAMVYVQGLVVRSGYEAPISPKLDWQYEDIPTQSQMRRYLSDLAILRDAMSLLPATPATPGTMDNLTHSTTNEIEQILLDIEYVVAHIFSALSRAGQFDFWAGHRPFPTAHADLGRTWEELDEMNATWANWQAATWYLLLYGNLKAEGVVE